MKASVGLGGRGAPQGPPQAPGAWARPWAEGSPPRPPRPRAATATTTVHHGCCRREASACVAGWQLRRILWEL